MVITEKSGYASKDNPHLAHFDPASVAAIYADDVEQTADAFAFAQNQGKLRNDYALRYMGVRTTFGQLDAEIDRVGRALMGYGVRQGDFVSIALPNVKEIVVYIYACWRIGAVANLIDPRTNADGVLARTINTGAKLLITLLDICRDKIDPVLDKLPVERVVVVSPADSLPFFGGFKPMMGNFIYGKKERKFRKESMAGKPKYLRHTDFLRQYTYEGDIRAKYQPDLPAAVVYTSGTSADGVIKGAVLTHKAYNSMFRAFSAILGNNDRHDTFGGFIPFFSAYGSLCGMHATLCFGAQIILTPVFHPNDFAKLVLRQKPNHFLGVPRFFETLTHSPKLAKKNHRLAFIKNPISGGDKVSTASLIEINNALVRSGHLEGLRIGYGSTELGSVISFMPRYDPREDTFDWKTEGNVGYVLPNAQVMVIDPETKEELPYGVDGEICVKSASMMLEYFGLPKETEEITFIAKDGSKYYRMGDKGHVDERGCIYFVDRYKRSIMRPDGHTVHPSPIENAIIQHPAVRNCAVVGLRQHADATGVIPTAFVLLDPAHAGLEEKETKALLLDIDALCLKKLPERDRAIAYTAVTALPYTPMGKINFRELEKETFVPKRFVITDFAFFPELRRNK